MRLKFEYFSYSHLFQCELLSQTNIIKSPFRIDVI